MAASGRETLNSTVRGNGVEPPLIFHQIGLHELIELFGQGYGFSDSPEHPYTFVCHYGLAIFDNG
jgi:hypothetical protein